MEGRVSVTFGNTRLASPLQVGEKVRLKSIDHLPPVRIKRKQMVYRLLKKKFKPTMIITHVYEVNGLKQIQLKPFNF